MVRCAIGFVEGILFAFVAANFLIVVPVVLVAYWYPFALFWFKVIGVVSAFLTASLIFKYRTTIWRRAIALTLVCRSDYTMLVLAAIISLLSFVILLATFYTPLWAQWDVAADYMPMAQSIVNTGTITRSIYSLTLQQMGYPPLMPVEYAFVITLFGISWIKLIAAAYLLATTLVVYEMTKVLWNGKAGVVSVLAFLSLPSTLAYMGVHSLYTDLPFVFYFWFVALMISRVSLGGVSATRFVMLSLGLALLVSSNVFGLVALAFVLSVLAYSILSRRINNILAAGIAGVVGVSSQFFVPLSTTLVNLSVALDLSYQQLGVATLSAILLSFFFYVSRGQFKNSILVKSGGRLLLAIAFVAMGGFYIIINAIYRGEIFAIWQFRSPLLLASFGIPRPSSLANASASASLLITSFGELLYGLFTSPGLAFVIPGALGGLVLLVWTSKDNRRQVLTYWLFFLLAIFVTLAYSAPSLAADFYRHILFLTPVLTVFFGIIVDYAASRYSRGLLTYLVLLLPIWVGTIYAWLYLGAGISWSQTYLLFSEYPSIDALGLGLVAASIIPIVALTVEACRVGVGATPRLHVALKGFFRVIAVALILFLAIVQPVTFLSGISNTVSQHGLGLSYYSGYQSASELGGVDQSVLSVVDFYRANIRDDFNTAGFGVSRFSFYLNRPFIELTFDDQLLLLAGPLTTNNRTLAALNLWDAGTRYFLLPQTWYYTYPVYSLYLDKYQLFKSIESGDFIQLSNGTVFHYEYTTGIGGFNLYTLSRFDTASNSHLLPDSNNTLPIISDSKPAFSSNINNVSVTYASSGMRYADNALEMHVKPFDKYPDPLVYSYFGRSINLSNQTFISFFWHGQSTGLRIEIQLWTGNWVNTSMYIFVDSWTGWAKLYVPLSQFGRLQGHPTMSNVTGIAFDFGNHVTSPANFAISSVVAGNGIDSFLWIPVSSS